MYLLRTKLLIVVVNNLLRTKDMEMVLFFRSEPLPKSASVSKKSTQNGRSCYRAFEHGKLLEISYVRTICSINAAHAAHAIRISHR